MKTLRAISAAVLLSAVLMHGPALAVDLKLLSSFGPSDRTSHSPAKRFIENVEKIGGGEIDIAMSGPEVVPAFEQLEPVVAGVFDLLYTHPAYHAGNKGLAVTSDARYDDPVKLRESKVWEYIDNYYQEHHGLKLLSMPAIGTHGYHCYLREEPKSAGDWNGMRIRGVNVYHGLIKSLGGVPVVMPMGEVYSALERGVVDGACAPAAGMLANKHYEVAKFRIEPTFGASVPMIAMNLDKWNGLTAEQQQILLDAGYRTELEIPWIGDLYLAEERAALAEAGVKVVTLPPEKAAEADATFRNSVWQLGVDCCGDAATELRDLAREAGLGN